LNIDENQTFIAGTKLQLRNQDVFDAISQQLLEKSRFQTGSPLATHVKFGTILPVPLDPSFDPELSELPKDFVQVESRFESAGTEDIQFEHASNLDVTSLSNRLDYVEHSSLIENASQDDSTQKHQFESETEARVESVTKFKLNLEPKKPAKPVTQTGRASSKPIKPWWTKVFKELLLETLLPAWLIVTFLLIPVGVRGESMYPTLSSGDFLVVAKLERWLAAWGFRPNYLHHGDVIVLKPPIESDYSFEPVSRLFESLPLLEFVANRLPENWKFRPYFVKRIIAMAGDTVEVKDGVVYLNAVKTREFYINTPAALEDSGPTVVKPGTVFVMGDNRLRSSSLDSRVFGLVHLQDVAGRAVLRLGHTSQDCKGVFECVKAWFFGWRLGGL
jgi:signal peptidase I